MEVGHEEYAASNPIKENNVKKKYRELKWSSIMKAHACWWKFLWLSKLALPYSRFLCRHNLYRKFPDGRCHWCGNNH